MAKQKEKKQTPVSRLMEYAGSFQYLAVASWVLAAVSAFVALVPFYFIWRLVKGVTGCTGLWCGTESVYLWLECSRFCNPVYADLYRGIDLFSFGSIPSAGKYEVKTDATYLISADWIYG